MGGQLAYSRPSPDDFLHRRDAETRRSNCSVLCSSRPLRFVTPNLRPRRPSKPRRRFHVSSLPACVRRPGLTAVVASACVVDVGAVDGLRYVDRQEKRFTVQGKPELTVSTFDGSIEVRPWDQPEVLVVDRAARRHQGGRRTALTMRIEQDGDRITVAVRHPDRAFDWVRGGRSARLIVSAPGDVRSATPAAATDRWTSKASRAASSCSPGMGRSEAIGSPASSSSRPATVRSG